jgi:hypothetical protein
MVEVRRVVQRMDSSNRRFAETPGSLRVLNSTIAYGYLRDQTVVRLANIDLYVDTFLVLVNVSFGFTSRLLIN